MKLSRSLKNIITYIAIPLLSAFFNVIKHFTIPGCSAFDMNDDATHTFVNLFITHNSLKDGQLPLINLWNNFGTPLIGDALTYPWAPHAQTYWFVDFPTGMLINRIILGFLTVLLLTIFYRRYMSRFCASACALLVMYSPGFIWHFAHHHYQACILLITWILLAQRQLLTKPRWGFFWLSLGWILLLISTSLNLVIFFIPFAFGYQWIITNHDQKKSTIISLTLALMSGIIFSLPDTLYLFIQMTDSMRADQSVEFSHMIKNTRLCIPMLILAVLYLMPYSVSDTNSEAKMLSAKMMSDTKKLTLLGFGTTILIILLISFPIIWKSIPLLRSMDISRFIWIGNIFLMIGVGKAGKVVPDTHSKRCLAPFLTPFLTSLLLAAVIIQISYAAYDILGYEAPDACHPNYSHHFSPTNLEKFPLPGYINRFAKHSRVAFNESIWRAYDIKINRDLIFGAGGRSMFMPKAFSQYLLNKNLIQVDTSPFAYHFKHPWRPDLLNYLGIRYVMQKVPSPEMENKGWILRGYTPEHYYLYETPLPTSLTYLIDKPNKRKYNINSDQTIIKGNAVSITLPNAIRKDLELVLTWTNRPGWKVYVDNVEREIFTEENQLIRVNIMPGDQKVMGKFEPVKPCHYVLSILISLLIIALGLYYSQKVPDTFLDTKIT